MKPLEGLPSIKSVYQALEDAAVDIYGFAMACHGGAAWLAEPVILDSLFLGLENFWFMDDASGRLSHKEFREEIFKTVWDKSRGNPAPAQVRIGTDVPLGHEEMAFYQLPQVARAAVYLRSKKRLPYATIGLILGITDGVARTEVEKA
ncbi:MAG: hypothetical protein ACXVB9_11650, partial [Bdellovibrionota bacterium]